MNRVTLPDEPPVTYVPGSWLALVTDDLCVLADVPADSRVLADCWAAAVTGQGLDAVLGLLAGVGASAYAAATRTDDGLRVVLAGAGRAEVSGVPVDSSDEVFVGRPPARLTSGADTDDVWSVLPLLRGIAPAGAVGIATSAAAPTEPSVPAESSVEPEFAPGGTLDQVPSVGPDAVRPVEPDVARPLEPIDLPPPEPDRAPSINPEPDQEPGEEQNLFAPPPEPEVGLLESLTWREAAPVLGPLVMSVACPRDHPNPPWAQTCRECGEPVSAQQPALMARPPLGALALSTGEVVELDRDVVLGRQPTADSATLVPLESAVNDVSRNHVRVGLSDWLVQVIDLGSTNGTVVTLPGEAAVALRPHDPFTILPGSTIAIGHEVTMRYELP